MTPTTTPERRVALVTGASRGLGATLAGFLAGEGFDLVIDGRHDGPLRREARRLRGLGAAVTMVPGDVADPTHRKRLLGAAQQRGRLDLLVHNAALLGRTPLPNLTEYPLPVFRRILETNVVAPLALTQLVLPLLAASRGKIVMISSDAAKGGYEGWGAYGSTKAALDLLGKTLSTELETSQVAVVIVDPGDMRTPGVRPAFTAEAFSARPLPDVTLPFWAWLLGQPGRRINGLRFEAQSERWEALTA
ncbi:MAG: SDR family NAD(P)-dependent oxidoreductase [Thermoplasmata archaeon]